MPYVVVEAKLKTLPEEALSYADEYINYLIYKFNSENSKKINPRLANRKAGTIRDDSFYMAPDFDETPECFKDYVENDMTIITKDSKISLYENIKTLW